LIRPEYQQTYVPNLLMERVDLPCDIIRAVLDCGNVIGDRHDEFVSFESLEFHPVRSMRGNETYNLKVQECSNE